MRTRLLAFAALAAALLTGLVPAGAIRGQLKVDG
jgi:hypothetical protein